MTVQLHSTHDLPVNAAYDNWLSITGAATTLDPIKKFPELAARLEMAFMEIRPLWWKLAKDMGVEPGADYARAPTATAFGSDFGVMLAWSWLVAELIDHNKSHLVVCNDPWLFRHLASLPGIKSGHAPAIWPKRLFFLFRGLMARSKVAGLMAISALLSRRYRKVMTDGDPTLLVYAHPRSTPLNNVKGHAQGNTKGRDEYFGNLMAEIPALKRLLHGDSTLTDIKRLCTDGKTTTIHAWGSVLFALRLLTVKWRPFQADKKRSCFWLINRAATIENGGGGPAMTCWQMHCQDRWLADKHPSCVSWPWENHAWERALCRSARTHKVQTIGYQHTVIGPHQINYATASNRDGLKSIPDIVAADGPAYANELRAWGIPEERLVIGGAFRFKKFDADIYDPDGPVFLPLSSSHEIARQQLAAGRRIAQTGKRVLVKAHPMYPMEISEAENLTRTEIPLVEQAALSSVVYSTGTSGLDAVLLGLPAYRLQLEDRIAIDVLPEGVSTQAVTLETIESIIQVQPIRPNVSWDDVFTTVDLKQWRELLGIAKLSTEQSNANFIKVP